MGSDADDVPGSQNGLCTGHRIPVSIHVADSRQDRGSNKVVQNGSHLTRCDPDRLLDKQWYARADRPKLERAATEWRDTNEECVESLVEESVGPFHSASTGAFICERFRAAAVF